MAELEMIAVEKLHPHPDNPRKDVGDVSELADSIKAKGIFQNMTVVPSYQVESVMNKLVADPDIKSDDQYVVIIGHRRLAAAKLVGLTEVPCVVADMTPKEQLQTMLMENMQRTDLTVYEQAQGFQMMSDMGDTVDIVAEKTGFSKTTVRRRLKMAELDQQTLKDVSDRQISLSDFDRLAQIEDISERNRCLEKIGTYDFNSAVTTSLRHQAIKAAVPDVKAYIKQLKAKAIKESETWGGKYEGVGKYSYSLSEWETEKAKIPAKLPDELFYYLDTKYGSLRLFKKKEKAKPVKRSQEEIDREKRIRATWDELTEKTAVAHDLRVDFVKGLTITKKNIEAILQGAVIFGVYGTFCYASSNTKGVCNALGIEDVWSSNRNEKALAALQLKMDQEKLPELIYALFNDDGEIKYACGSAKEWPKHDASPKLDALYSWLKLLGYEMSDDEKALQDGTHELFKRGESDD